jgi:hypothetical protein
VLVLVLVLEESLSVFTCLCKINSPQAETDTVKDRRDKTDSNRKSAIEDRISNGLFTLGC